MVSDKRKVDETEIDDSCNGSSTRMRRTQIDYCLPDDVIFIILLCFPADILHNVMRLVCRQWNNIIKSPLFLDSHLGKYSTSNGLLIHHMNIRGGYIVKLRSSHDLLEILEVKDLNFPYIKRVSASCNGLLYVIGPKECELRCPSYIVNPVTKEYLPLPLFPEGLERSKCCFGYAAASRVYKVMHYSDDESRCLILSVGIDKAWRKVDISQLSSTIKRVMKYQIGRCRCLTLKGSVYWLSLSLPIILRFDFETEAFVEIPISPECDYVACNNGLLSMEDSVCLWLNRSREVFIFEFWLLKDPETGNGQWEKMFNVNIEGQSWLGKNAEPFGWLRSNELLVFWTKGQIMVYDINNGIVHQTGKMKIPDSQRRIDCHEHVESLVPLNNLSLVMTPQLPFKSQEKVYSEKNMMAEKVYSEKNMMADIKEFKLRRVGRRRN